MSEFWAFYMLAGAANATCICICVPDREPHQHRHAYAGAIAAIAFVVTVAWPVLGAIAMMHEHAGKRGKERR